MEKVTFYFCYNTALLFNGWSSIAFNIYVYDKNYINIIQSCPHVQQHDKLIHHILGTTSKFWGNSLSLQCTDRGGKGSVADGLVKIEHFYEKCIIPLTKWLENKKVVEKPIFLDHFYMIIIAWSFGSIGSMAQIRQKKWRKINEQAFRGGGGKLLYIYIVKIGNFPEILMSSLMSSLSHILY